MKKNLTNRFTVQYTDRRAEQSRAEQSRAEQSRAEQRLICNRCDEIYNGILRYSDSYDSFKGY